MQLPPGADDLRALCAMPDDHEWKLAFDALLPLILIHDGRLVIRPAEPIFTAIARRSEQARRAGIASAAARANRTTVERPLNDRSTSVQEAHQQAVSAPHMGQHPESAAMCVKHTPTRLSESASASESEMQVRVPKRHKTTARALVALAPPSLHQIAEWISQNFPALSPDTRQTLAADFYDTFTGRGWLDNRSPIYDWRPILNRWARRALRQQIDRPGAAAPMPAIASMAKPASPPSAPAVQVQINTPQIPFVY
jgi:hypothetical protein